MEKLLALMVVAMVLAAAAKLVVEKAKQANGYKAGAGKKKYSYDPEAEVWPFKKRPVMTAPEQILYHKLRLAAPQLMILSQVDLGQILEVQPGHNFQAWRNRINRMSIDFVICDKRSNIICCIELDDSSHEREDRKEADAKKEKALRSAGIELIRLPVKAMPSPEVIRGMIDAAIPTK